MADKKRVRRTVTAQSPGPPAQTIGVDAGLLATLAGKVGELTAEVRSVKAEVREVKVEVKGVKEQVGRLEESVQQQAITNETAHGEMKAEFSALGATVAGLVADKQRTPPSSGASAGRSEDPIAKADKFLEFGAKWGPRILKAGGAVLAALLSWWATVLASKGGHPTP